MITGLDHIAIAVQNLQSSIEKFSNDFGLIMKGVEDVPAAKTTAAFFPVENSNIELLYPLEGDGPIEKFLQKKGGGLHHLCFRSDNLDEDVRLLKEKGYHFLTDEPFLGAHDARVIFIHPKSCDGVLIELNQINEKVNICD